MCQCKLFKLIIIYIFKNVRDNKKEKYKLFHETRSHDPNTNVVHAQEGTVQIPPGLGELNLTNT